MIIKLIRPIILIACLLFLTSTSFAALPKRIATEFISLDDAFQTGFEIFVNEKDLTHDISSGDFNLKIFFDGRQLLRGKTYPQNIKVEIYKYIDGKKSLYTILNRTVKSERAASRILLLATVPRVEATQELYFDVYDSNNILYSTFSKEVTITRSEGAEATDFTTVPDFDCEDGDGECLIEYLLRQVTFSANYDRNLKTVVYKNDKGRYTVNIPIKKGRTLKRKVKNFNVKGGTSSGNSTNTSLGSYPFFENEEQTGRLFWDEVNNAIKFNFDGAGKSFSFNNDGSFELGSKLSFEAAELDDELVPGSIEYDGEDLYFTNNSGRIKLGAQGPIGPPGSPGPAGPAGSGGGSSSGIDLSNGGYLNGTINFIAGGLIEDAVFNGSFQYKTGASNGLVLTSDSNGNASWDNVSIIINSTILSTGPLGAVQFSGTSNGFDNDAANFFWDDANDRLGVGLNNPAYTVDLSGIISARKTSVTGESAHLLLNRGAPGSEETVATLSTGRFGASGEYSAYLTNTTNGRSNNFQDITIYEDGKVGINFPFTSSAPLRPQASLDIRTNDANANILSVHNTSMNELFTVNQSGTLVNGSLAIRDGSQADGFVLTSDINGLASWQAAPSGVGVNGTASGIAGAIQFSDGANGFNSDAINFFWNDGADELQLAGGTVIASSYLRIGNSAGQMNLAGTDFTIGSNATTTSLSLAKNGNTALHIDNNGSVGIGTNSPDALLDLSGNGSGQITFEPVGIGASQGMRMDFTSVANSLITMAQDRFRISASGGVTVLDHNYSNWLAFQYQGSERARYDNNGWYFSNSKVGINTSSPRADLEIDLSDASEQGLILKAASSQTANFLELEDFNGAILTSISAAGSLTIADGTEATGFVLTSDANGLASWQAAAAGSNINGSASYWNIDSNIASNTGTNADEAVDDFVFGSNSLDDDTDTNHDSRMFFNKSRSAFRAGSVDSTQWDDTNTGNGSVAFGSNSTANGEYSLAFGSNTLASGDHSIALGDAGAGSIVSSGLLSFSRGKNFPGVGSGSISASGILSSAVGITVGSSGVINASGLGADIATIASYPVIARGEFSQIRGNAGGLRVVANGDVSSIRVKYVSEALAEGQASTIIADSLWEVKARGNIATAIGSGDGIRNLQDVVIADGNGSFARGVTNRGPILAKGMLAHAIGDAVSANGDLSFVIGRGLGPADLLSSDQGHSLTIGFNSNAATFFVGGAAGGSTTGNIGIATASPTAKLDIIGDIKITDGTEADGFVLTSDANGLASWQAAAGGAGDITSVGDCLTGSCDDFTLTAATAGTRPLAIRAASSQTATLTEWQNNIGTTFAHITALGEFSNNGRTSNSQFFGENLKGPINSVLVGQDLNGGLTATGNNVLIGYNSEIDTVSTQGYNSVIVGSNSTINGTTYTNSNTLVGSNSTISGGNTINSIILGSNSNVTGYNAIAIGNTASANNESMAIGTVASATGGASIAIGNRSTASGRGGVAIGQDATASARPSVAIGWDALANAAGDFVIGSSRAVDGPFYNFYFGKGKISSNPENILFHATSTNGTDNSAADFIFAAGQGTGTGNGGDLVFQTANGGSTGAVSNNLHERMRITQDGTTAITGSLQYLDGNEATGRVLTSDANGLASWQASGGGGASSGIAGAIQLSGGAGGFSSNAAELFWDEANERLGIGITTPLADLHVNGNIIANNLTLSSGATLAQKYITSLTVTAGNLKPIAGFREPGQGSLALLIQVQQFNSGHSGTKTYQFQGGWNQISTSWSRMVPMNEGRGHGDSLAGFDVYARNSGDSRAYEFALGANLNNKSMSISFINLGAHNLTYTSLTSSPEVAISSASNVYSNRGLYVENHIGIGVASTDADLEVGNGTVNFIDGIDDILVADDVEIDGNLYVEGTIFGAVNGVSAAGATGALQFSDGSGSFNSNGRTISWDNTNSRLGVGTSSPATNLTVFADNGSSILRIEADPTNTDENDNASINLVQDGGTLGAWLDWGGTNNDTFQIRTTHVNSEISFSTASTTNAIWIENAGNVGIGAVTPAALLDVGEGTANFIDGIDDVLVADDVEIDGDLYVQGNIIGALSGSATASGAAGAIQFSDGSNGFTSDASNFFWDNINGSLGIGTNLPDADLNIRGINGGSLHVQGNNPITLPTTYSMTGASDGLMIKAFRTSGGGAKKYVDLISQEDDGFGKSQFRFFTTNTTGANAIERMTIDNNGNVGIGTNLPAGRLEVNGTTIVDGLIASKRSLDNTSGAAVTIDWNESNRQEITIAHNTTFTFTDPTGIANLTLFVIQDATGSRVPTWPANVRWSGGSAPTLTTTANQMDIISCVFRTGNYYCQAALDFTP